MTLFNEQASRYLQLNLRNSVLAGRAVNEYQSAGGARLMGDNPEKGHLLKEALDRAEVEIDRLEGCGTSDAMALEYEDAIAGADILRTIKGE